MSISAVHRTLYRFWSEVDPSVPVYLSGHVPDGAAFPYLTFDVLNEAALSFNYLTVFDWHKQKGDGTNVNKERAELMDKIAQAIPNEGVVLEMPGNAGFLLLTRNEMGYQSYYDDQEDETVIGGRTSYQVNFYSD